LTYEEIKSILATAFRVDWEAQLWFLALKSDKPMDTYRELMVSVARTSQEQETNLDELPKQRLDWLRAT